MPDFLPRADLALLDFATNFVVQVTERPNVFGLKAESVDEIVRLVRTFSETLNEARVPLTRTAVAVNRKDTIRAAMKERIRQACRVIRGQPNLTTSDLLSIGCRARKTVYTRRAGVPSEKPVIDVETVGPHAIVVHVGPATPSRRRRPTGMNAAVVLIAYGDLPTDPSGWIYAGMPRQRTMRIDLPTDLPPGTRVWARAFWTGPRHDSGPSSEAVGIMTAGATLRVACAA